LLKKPMPSVAELKAALKSAARRAAEKWRALITGGVLF
jgi:hypothetical protein